MSNQDTSEKQFPLNESLDQQTEDRAESNPARDLVISKLQKINSELRAKIKDLNFMVEKAIAKQAKMNKKGDPSVYASDPDHLIKVRTKEIENTRKAIDHNNAQILQLNQKLKSMGQLFDGVSLENGGLEHPLDWESKYIQQLELKKQLTQTIKKLEK